MIKQLTVLLLAMTIFSCSEKEKPNYTVITGEVQNNTAETALVRGNNFEARIPIAPDGTFSDTLHLKDNGFYELYIGRERTGIYLENGQNLNVTVNPEQFDETVKYSGDLSEINNYLAQKYLWNEQNLNFRDLFSLDEDAFIEKLDSDQKSLDSIYATYKISNKDFRKRLDEENKYSRAALIENYIDAHRYYTGKEDYQVGSSFYDNIKDINFQDTLAFRNSTAYQNLLQAHFNRMVNEDTYESGDNDHTILYLKKVDSSLPDGYAKDKLMFEYLQFGLKPNENLDEAYAIYKNSNPDPENLSHVTARYNQLKALTAGNPSPEFNFENHKGGKTSLKDLEGKYVYIDVWATWCAPCLREIPYLKEVEEEYKNKNIQFVGISIDEEKDYDKWKQMVDEKSLAGIQLMADSNWNSDFVKQYAILGIPRFILIDPKGNIVSADAPRPSDPLLKQTLNGLL